MEQFTGKRKTVTADCFVKAPPRRVFPQLCPRKEYDWISSWKTDLIYTESGYAELDCVFKTYFPSNREDVWVVSRFEPFERIEFIRVSSTRAMRYIVALTPIEGGTRITWTQVATGLTAEGNKEISSSLQQETHNAMVEDFGKMLSYYLETGKLLERTHAD